MEERWRGSSLSKKNSGNRKSLSQRGRGKIASHQTQERVNLGISLTGGEVFHRRLTYNKTAPAVVWGKTTNWHQPQHNLDLSSTLLADSVSVLLIPRKLLYGQLGVLSVALSICLPNLKRGPQKTITLLRVSDNHSTVFAVQAQVCRRYKNITTRGCWVGCRPDCKVSVTIAEGLLMHSESHTKEALTEKFRARMPSRSVDLKVSAQNQCEIDDARNSGHTRGGRSCSTTPSLHCDSMQRVALHRGTEDSNDAHAAACSVRPGERGWHNTHGRGNTTS